MTSGIGWATFLEREPNAFLPTPEGTPDNTISDPEAISQDKTFLSSSKFPFSEKGSVEQGSEDETIDETEEKDINLTKSRATKKNLNRLDSFRKGRSNFTRDEIHQGSPDEVCPFDQEEISDVQGDPIFEENRTPKENDDALEKYLSVSCFGKEVTDKSSRLRALVKEIHEKRYFFWTGSLKQLTILAKAITRDFLYPYIENPSDEKYKIQILEIFGGIGNFSSFLEVDLENIQNSIKALSFLALTPFEEKYRGLFLFKKADLSRLLQGILKIEPKQLFESDTLKPLFSGPIRKKVLNLLIEKASEEGPDAFDYLKGIIDTLDTLISVNATERFLQEDQVIKLLQAIAAKRTPNDPFFDSDSFSDRLLSFIFLIDLREGFTDFKEALSDFLDKNSQIVFESVFGEKTTPPSITNMLRCMLEFAEKGNNENSEHLKNLLPAFWEIFLVKEKKGEVAFIGLLEENSFLFTNSYKKDACQNFVKDCETFILKRIARGHEGASQYLQGYAQAIQIGKISKSRFIEILTQLVREGGYLPALKIAYNYPGFFKPWVVLQTLFKCAIHKIQTFLGFVNKT